MRPPSLLWRKYWLLPVLLVAGYLGNYFNLPLFFGVDFIFGSVATLMVIAYYGSAWGILSALIAGSYTVILWNHPYALMILLLEAAFIGWQRRRRWGNLTLLATVYWVILGMPLVYLFYRFGVGMTEIPTRLIMVKQATNGIFNSLIASFLITVIDLGTTSLPVAPVPSSHKLSFEQTLFNVLAAFLFFPLLLVTVLNGQQAFQSMEQNIAQELGAIAYPVQNAIQLWLGSQIQGVKTVAAQSRPLLTQWGEGKGAIRPELNLLAQSFQTAFTSYDALLIGDRQGNIVAGFPPFNEAGETQVGRYYPQRLAELKGNADQPVINDIHRDGTTISPHAGITVPILNQARQRQGFVYAALNLEQLAALVIAGDRPSIQDIILLDRQNRILAASSPDLIPMETFSLEAGGKVRTIQGQTSHWFPDEAISPMLRWRKSYYFRSLPINGSPDWQLIVRLYATDQIDYLQLLSVKKLAILLALTVGGLGTSMVISRRIASPLLTLSRFTTDIPNKLAQREIEPLSLNSQVTEVAVLNDNFNEMLGTIKNQFQTIEMARDTLESRVQERTQALLVINEELAAEIQERERIEVELRQAKDNAEAANRTKSEFLANISHEIRTPMNAILGFCELLQGTTESPRSRSYLAAINSSSQTLMALIDDILDISKIEAGKLVVHRDAVNLADLLRETQQIFMQKARDKGLHFTTQLDLPVPPVVDFDEVRLRQILFNLVGNAIKFTEVGGVSILITGDRQGADQLQLSIQVMDTGIGIAPADQERIFDVFTQSEGQSTRKYGGTGLGLTISKRLAHLLGGDLTLTSEVGKGSVFTLHFAHVPLTAIAPDSPSLPQPSDFSQFPHLRVLVTDDVESNRRLLQGFFEVGGHDVVAVDSGPAAIARSQQQTFDLILMDLMMPEMDGETAIYHIRQTPQNGKTPILMVTASSEPLGHLLSPDGCQGILLKPVTQQALINALNHLFPVGTTPTNPAARPVSAPVPAALTPAQRQTLIALLAEQEAQVWEHLRHTLISRELRAFGDRLFDWGQEYQWAALIDYATALRQALDNFDSHQLQTLMNEFPHLRATLDDGTDSATTAS